MRAAAAAMSSPGPASRLVERARAGAAARGARDASARCPGRVPRRGSAPGTCRPRRRRRSGSGGHAPGGRRRERARRGARRGCGRPGTPAAPPPRRCRGSTGGRAPRRRDRPRSSTGSPRPSPTTRPPCTASPTRTTSRRWSRRSWRTRASRRSSPRPACRRAGSARSAPASGATNRRCRSKLDAVDAVVTGAAVAIADTGTFVLDALAPDQGRRAHHARARPPRVRRPGRRRRVLGARGRRATRPDPPADVRLRARRPPATSSSTASRASTARGAWTSSSSVAKAREHRLPVPSGLRGSGWRPWGSTRPGYGRVTRSSGLVGLRREPWGSTRRPRGQARGRPGRLTGATRTSRARSPARAW